MANKPNKTSKVYSPPRLNVVGSIKNLAAQIYEADPEAMLSNYLLGADIECETVGSQRVLH